MINWIYTADELPKKVGRYLTVDENGWVEIAKFFKTGATWFDEFAEKINPIAWSELPRFVRRKES